MFYDVRISMGMLFTLIGTILTAFGLATRTNTAVYAKSLGIDANLWWGLVLLGFGLAAMMLGRRGQMRMDRDKEKGTGNRGARPSEIRAR
jgi:hypothetical protein